jgi:predicted DsbA family dithiol-disulfide isomerase
MIGPSTGVAPFVKVEIWSDVVCPWCYIGKRHFEAALAAFDHRDEVEVVWRSYELDPTAPPEREGDYAGRIAAKYGMTREEAQVRIDRITSTAAQAGLVFDFDIARPGNTFDAHRLIHLGAERGLQDVVKERLLAATFVEGEPIGDRETLVRLAAAAGLDPEEARTVLEGDAHAEAVRADEREAVAYAISGVPFFVIDQTYGISGAQPPEVFIEILERAWAETHKPALVVTGSGDASACEGDACEL